MWKPALPLSPGDSVKIDEVSCRIVTATTEVVIFRAQNDEELTLSVAEAFDRYEMGRLEYDNALLVKLDAGSADDRALAKHARRPLQSFAQAPQYEALRKHFQAVRMGQMGRLKRGLPGLARTKDGYAEAAKILNEEEKQLFRDGVSWAREDADTQGGGLVPIDRIWRKTLSISALAPRHYGKGVKAKGDARDLWEMCVCWLIYYFYLLRPQNSFEHVYDEYIYPAYEEFCARMNVVEDFWLCSRSYERLMFRCWSARELAQFRNDVKKQLELTIITKIREILHPFQRIEIDSTEMDWRVWHLEGGKMTFIRPFITIAIDVCTRLIVGIWISWQHTSYEATRQVLRQVFWPKSERDHRGAISFWPSGMVKPEFGEPTAVADRGAENVNASAVLGAGALGVNLILCPSRSPKSKPHVERTMGHFAVPLADEIHAARLEPSTRTVYGSKAEALKQLPAIILKVTQWAVDDYNTRYHRGLKAVPLEAFHKLSPGRIEFPAIDKKIYLGRLVTAEVQREGATVCGELYTCDDLQPILERHANNYGKKRHLYQALIEPDDPARVAILDDLADSPHFIIAKSREPARTQDRSLDEVFADHEAGRKAKRKKSPDVLRAQHAVKKRRDAKRPEILAEIAEDLTTHATNVAKISEKSAHKLAAKASEPPKAPALESKPATVIAQAPRAATEIHPGVVEDDEDEGDLYGLFDEGEL